jgi:adenine deaminase
LETIANIIGAEEVEKLAAMEGTIGLGEVMDFVSVLNANEYVLKKIEIGHRYCLIINGHAPLLRGEDLDAYIDAGIWSDHESTYYEEALEKVRKGMYVFIREGSAWRDLKALLPLIKDSRIDYRFLSFASDDVNVIDLINEGHMDRIINLAIEYGVDPIKAIQLATIGPAMRIHLEDHVGVIGPARIADIVFTRNIEYIKPHTVIANGEIIYYKNELKKEFKQPQYPEYALNTVKIARIPRPEEFYPRTNIPKEKVKVNIIEVKPGSALTKHVIEELPVRNGYIKADLSKDIIYAAVIDRHKATGSMGKGFIKGLGFKAGAIAQTIAHDTHNLIVAGNSVEDMSLAVKRIWELQGGIVIVDHGEIIGELPLRLAGLMSIEEPEIVYKKYKSISEKLRERYGLEFESFFMTLALTALPVIPEIRLTDKGLVDVGKAKIIPLIAE